MQLSAGRLAGMVGGPGGSISTARLLPWQTRCVLTLLCRVRLLATTVVLSSAHSLSLSLSSPPPPLLFPFLSRPFPLVLIHSQCGFLPLLLISLFCTSSTRSSPTAPPPCCYRRMTLLTTQTPCGSGNRPMRSSQELRHQSHHWLLPPV